MDEQDFKDIYNGVKEAPDDMHMFDIEQYLIWLNSKMKKGDINDNGNRKSI